MNVKSLIFTITIMFYSGFISAEDVLIENIKTNIDQINILYEQDSESLPYLSTVELTRSVIRQRDFYNTNILAKAFSLLADVAINSGDLAKAMQFAQDGTGLIGVDKELHLQLLLKVVSGHYYKGQFHQAKELAEQAVDIAETLENSASLITSLSYRAMINGLIAEHEKASADIEIVKGLLEKNPEFNDQIAFLNVLARAHYYLDDNRTAVALYNKILKLRFELKKVANIDQTYHSLAQAYFELGLLDDAYNAFWEAFEYAKTKNAPIRIAYAESGLGKILFHQEKYTESLKLLEKAERGFQGYSLSQPYLSCLLDLAKVTEKMGDMVASYNYLQKAEQIALSTELTEQQIELHLMMAKMYFDDNKLDKALEQYFIYTSKDKLFEHSHQHIPNIQEPSTVASKKSRDFSLQFANQSTLNQQYQVKYKQQKSVIDLLSALLIIVLLGILWLGFRLRKIKLNLAYDEIEKPIDYIIGPSQTKKLYQHHYKMARKYQYSIAVGYFSIENWSELTFQFNNKVVAEVKSALAVLFNDIKGEFVEIGIVNDGEYLFLAPHIQPETLQEKFDELAQAIKVQFFANLGEFSLKVRYDCRAPNIQDIDPYIFLSRISDSGKR